jgi:pimeloyl-ACP methyl ester carboxylesterase
VNGAPQWFTIAAFERRGHGVKHPGRTAKFLTADGSVMPDSIAETAYLRLGGIDQWVMIRGEKVSNPALVLLHGGPGFPETGFFRYFNSALEKVFTVIYWEQRGTGKSFSRAIPEASMTIERFIADLDELVDAMCKRLRKKRVVILGHSWGSALGTLYAAKFPAKVSVYVGTGQIGDLQASEESSYAFVLAEAERRGNRSALEQLRAIGKPPYTAKTLGVQRRWLTRFVGLMRGWSFWQVLGVLRRDPEGSIFNVPNVARGAMFSLRTMWNEVSRLNLETSAPALAMPVFFFLGRHDHQVACETSAAYFEKLIAPAKQLVWFEESAHMPPFEEPERFNRLMAELVAPVARG